jgi:hypothetical protein
MKINKHFVKEKNLKNINEIYCTFKEASLATLFIRHVLEIVNLIIQLPVLIIKQGAA